jgi:hypothetical protein
VTTTTPPIIYPPGSTPPHAETSLGSKEFNPKIPIESEECNSMPQNGKSCWFPVGYRGEPILQYKYVFTKCTRKKKYKRYSTAMRTCYPVLHLEPVLFFTRHENYFPPFFSFNIQTWIGWAYTSSHRYSSYVQETHLTTSRRYEFLTEIED